MKLYTLIFLTIITINLSAQTFTQHQVDTVSTFSVHAADLDSDGFNDIVAALGNPNIVKWYKNNGDNTFTANILANKAGLGPRAVQIVDINQDGKMDVVLASDLDTSVYWYENDGSENFTEHTISSTASNANSIVAMDMDNDQDIDILTSAFGGFGSTAKVILFKNSGTGSFTEHIVSDGTSFVLNAYPAELTGDTYKDIVIAETQTDKLRLFKQNANTTFTEQTEISTAVDAVTGLFAIDINNDTSIDVLTASQNDSTLRWHEGTTAHTIASNADTNGAYAIYAADLDFDDDIDVIAAALAAGTVTYHNNNGSQVFASSRLSGDTTGASSVHAADIDDNGSLDIISGAETGVWWHESSISDIIFKNSFK